MPQCQPLLPETKKCEVNPLVFVSQKNGILRVNSIPDVKLKLDSSLRRSEGRDKSFQ